MGKTKLYGIKPKVNQKIIDYISNCYEMSLPVGVLLILTLTYNPLLAGKLSRISKSFLSKHHSLVLLLSPVAVSQLHFP